MMPMMLSGDELPPGRKPFFLSFLYNAKECRQGILYIIHCLCIFQSSMQRVSEEKLTPMRMICLPSI